MSTEQRHEACIRIVVHRGFRHLLLCRQERLFALVEYSVIEPGRGTLRSRTWSALALAVNLGLHRRHLAIVCEPRAGEGDGRICGRCLAPFLRKVRVETDDDVRATRSQHRYTAWTFVLTRCASSPGARRRSTAGTCCAGPGTAVPASRERCCVLLAARREHDLRASRLPPDAPP